MPTKLPITGSSTDRYSKPSIPNFKTVQHGQHGMGSTDGGKTENVFISMESDDEQTQIKAFQANQTSVSKRNNGKTYIYYFYNF